MRLKIYHLVLSSLIYGILTAFTGLVFVFPDEIVSLAIFLPPILGIMWGFPATVGCYIGAVIAVPELQNFSIATNPSFLVEMAVRIIPAGYLPYLLWNNLKASDKDGKAFHFTTGALWNFIAILFVTFAVTSVLRTLTASATDLEAVKGLFDFGKNNPSLSYLIVCFFNDFFVALFFDMVLFFVLVNRNLTEQNEQLTEEEHQAIKFALICYGVFPLAFAYLDIYQIYGMDRLEVWTSFVLECLIMIDAYNALVIYLILRYRRSIMVEIVFLVAVTVFLSASVLGLISSVAMNDMANAHVEDSLREMSIIGRERLDRTFFCIRQAVNGMERQAIQNIESYERFVEDADYRKEYFEIMKKFFSSIAIDTDGALSFYLRLDPKIEGGKGGFSMARADSRWEGALSPFVQREPVDLSRYFSDDIENVGWYYIPIEAKCATWIEPYVDPVTKVYVISYVAPLFVEGKCIGVIGADIDFNFIVQELRRMSIYDYGYVYLMNRKNVVLYHRDQPQGTIFQPNPEFQEKEIYLTNGMWLGIATPLTRVHDVRNHILMQLVMSILIVAFIVSVASIILASRSVHPLKGMTDAAKRIASGDLNVQISYESGNELGILVRSIREMAAKLETYVYRDKLTGLRNAAAYLGKSTELNTKSKTDHNLNYAVIIFDVNFLKKVNDNYGHQAGNLLLQHAAAVMGSVFENSYVYRFGGDEFAAVLEDDDYGKREELIKIFDEKIAEESFEFSGDTINVSVARGMGIYEYGMNFADVVKKADAEMYLHKSAIKAKYGEDVR